MEYEGINANHSFIQDWSNIRGRFRGESPINRAFARIGATFAEGSEGRSPEIISFAEDSWKNIWRKYLNTPHVN